MLQTVLAPNASPLTLDGTRTYIIGDRRPAIIDPGPDDPDHLDAIVDALDGGDPVAILITHGHPDHLAGAAPLAERLDVPVRRLAGGSLRDGEEVRTDAGGVLAVATPGHTRDHLAFHWPARDAVFCGDLMMGGEDTTLIAAPEGRLGPYLASLERVRALHPATVYPAHGPPFQDPEPAFARYVHHREERLDQVLRAVADGARDYDPILVAVYGDGLAPELERAAMRALKAYLEHLQALGRIRRIGRGWEVT